MDKNKLIRHQIRTYSEEELVKRSSEHFDYLNNRRTIREFSSRPIPDKVLENLVKSASTAPSGANKQPWTFCVVTGAEVKKQIRLAAEKEEYESYKKRMSQEWLNDLSPLGTNWEKPFLEIAPALIVVFKQSYDVIDDVKKNNYYVTESVGLACGILLESIHYCGLVAVTHTPSPMNFLSKILNRPENEKPFLLIPVGYPPETVMVPDIHRKNIEDIAVWYT